VEKEIYLGDQTQEIHQSIQDQETLEVILHQKEIKVEILAEGHFMLEAVAEVLEHKVEMALLIQIMQEQELLQM
jgi:hypothetical protein